MWSGRIRLFLQQGTELPPRRSRIAIITINRIAIVTINRIAIITINRIAIGTINRIAIKMPLGFVPVGTPGGTPRQLEIRRSRAPVKPLRRQTLRSPRPKVPSALARTLKRGLEYGVRALQFSTEVFGNKREKTVPTKQTTGSLCCSCRSLRKLGTPVLTQCLLEGACEPPPCEAACRRMETMLEASLRTIARIQYVALLASMPQAPLEAHRRRVRAGDIAPPWLTLNPF